MAIRKRPWNRVNPSVYSMSTKGPRGFNMNICTYVTPVSMQPKRYLVGLYEGTQTLQNGYRSEQCVLQLLSQHQYRLVNLLGKNSGKTINKVEKLAQKNLLVEWNGFPVLKEALAVIRLQKVDQFRGGDHICFLYDVVDYANLNDADPLTLDTLRHHKIIRA